MSLGLAAQALHSLQVWITSGTLGFVLIFLDELLRYEEGMLD